ncbi:pyridoxamine 5'-phosphate oxidase family protein [Aspergillus mulundensis]|uniref:FMN-binding split barrel n=1 Tax=Aspergillus mulundensis TaxID=1810919 RepID=A0A3D8QC65_9EURO|nr:FMN-binding split barrel [Aspergillus mulundensis]RDW59321.1 FMN-binding split barrel [Aspergillus mulundensis]
MEPASLRRHTQRGTYDIESAKAVFDDCFTAHVSYVDKGLPQCLPMIALVMKEEAEEADGLEHGPAPLLEEGNTVVYLHGHPGTRIVELAREASLEPVKVCIVATKVDGLVLSSAPNGHTFNYRSAVIHGTCTLVKSKAIKRIVMRAVTNHIVPNRWEEVNPVASYQISLVSVIKVSIDSLSVKTRTGPPGIQPRDREVDGPDNENPPWVGVVPVWELLGDPAEPGLIPGGRVSENLRGHIERRNNKQQAHSRLVAG